MSNFTSDFEAVDRYYKLYGKTIHSNFPLPLPEAGQKQTDIRVIYEGYVPKRLDHSPVPRGLEWTVRDGTRNLSYYFSDGKELTFRFSDDGREIRFTHSWRHWKELRFPLINGAVAAALKIQGHTALHAASLVWKGRSFLFMGHSGRGKSTLAAALIDAGMSAHSDDIAIPFWEDARSQYGPTEGRISGQNPHIKNQSQSDSTDNDVPVIPAGYAMIKVKPEIIRLLGVQEARPVKIFCHHNEDDESWFRATELLGGFYNGLAPLAGIFILGNRYRNGQPKHKTAGDSSKPGENVEPITDNNYVQVNQISGMPATLELLEHIYGVSWMSPPGDSSLKLAARLAGDIPVFRLSMPNDLSQLQDAAGELLQRHINPLAGSYKTTKPPFAVTKRH